jgi:hypothetical protein
MYHAIGDGSAADAAQDPHYTVSADTFARHLGFAAANGGAHSARDWLANGGGSMLLTFDDGHVSNYALAFPILKQHGASADFFVNPGRVGTQGFATWAQLRNRNRRSSSMSASRARCSRRRAAACRAGSASSRASSATNGC